jgi:hypothetical protein
MNRIRAYIIFELCVACLMVLGAPWHFGALVCIPLIDARMKGTVTFPMKLTAFTIPLAIIATIGYAAKKGSVMMIAPEIWFRTFVVGGAMLILGHASALLQQMAANRAVEVESKT